MSQRPNNSHHDPQGYGERKAVVLTNDVVLDGTRVVRVTNVPTSNNVSNYQPGNAFLNKNNDPIGVVATSRNAIVSRMYKQERSTGNIIDIVQCESEDPYPNLSVSSDSGFAEHSPNVTPQSIRFSNNSNNVYHMPS